MKTNVASTSIDCYSALQNEGKLTRLQLKIMAAMEPWRDFSLQELVQLTGLPINTVSGRCNELRTAKHIEHGETRPCTVTGRMVHPVKLVSTQGGLF